MNIANPLGLWALLAIPVLIGIYFLRRRPVQVPVSVLFLIEQARTPSRGGKRLERLRTPPQFWLQLLALFLLVALLGGLHFGRTQQVGKIAVVVDSSASVSAFKERLIEELSDRLDSLANPLYAVELVALPSAQNSPRLYRGGDIGELIQSLDDWAPMDSGHNPLDALRLARGLVGAEGVVIFATDGPNESLPEGVHILSVGESKPNVGFAGLHAGEAGWSAILKNYSDAEVATQWWIEREGAPVTPPRKVSLPSSGMIELSGQFPPDSPPGQGIILRLPEDAFRHDNTLPIARPGPKVLYLALGELDSESAVAEYAIKLSASLPNTTFPPDNNSPDLVILSGESARPASQNAVIFASEAEDEVLTGGIIPAAHPLTEGLPWGALMPFQGGGIEIQGSDTGLLWVGKNPVIALRTTQKGAEHLLINLDLERSNANRLPAVALLIHRFTDRVRSQVDRPYSGNVEVGQALDIGSSGEDLYRAPQEPGFFERSSPEGELLYSGAASFADVAEADLRGAAPADDVPGSVPGYSESLNANTSFWRVLLLLSLAALLASWAVNRVANSTEEGGQEA